MSIRGSFRNPTPYPDVNEVLRDLLDGAGTVLGTQFVGMYVHGSLASGDFEPERSDIDFLVVTADTLPDDMIEALEAMHQRLAASGLPWAQRLDGSYIPRDALRRHDPAQACFPELDSFDETFGVAQHGSDWVIQRHVIREHGLALAGPPPQTLIDPVQPAELQQAVSDQLRGRWSRQLRGPTRLKSPEYQAYAVLTMCRALYTLEHATVVSKAVAPRWARAALGERWGLLIDWAVAWRRDDRSDNLYATVEFIQYVLECLQRFETAAGV